jgi:hypothetical protein
VRLTPGGKNEFCVNPNMFLPPDDAGLMTPGPFLCKHARRQLEEAKGKGTIFRPKYLPFTKIRINSGTDFRPTEPYILAISCIGHKECPLEWWKKNEANFPLLANLAKRYLAAPATSSDSERVFNVARESGRFPLSKIEPDCPEC